LLRRGSPLYESIQLQATRFTIFSMRHDDANRNENEPKSQPIALVVNGVSRFSWASCRLVLQPAALSRGGTDAELFHTS
jgi:hypothetical protein